MDSKKIVKKATQKISIKPDSVKFWRNAAFILLGLVILTQLFSISVIPKFKIPEILLKGKNSSDSKKDDVGTNVDIGGLQSKVLPEEGVRLPIVWGDLGKKMVSDGVIDETNFRELFGNGLSDSEAEILSGVWDGEIVMTSENNRFLLDMLWAFGLANKNEILESGEMTDEKYGGDASQYASTGGWTLARGDVMEHYSTHPYIVLNRQQQELVDRVSLEIYRPCCGNSTHFPDCNHGMAMLGLLQLMAANEVGEQEMYEVALKVNSFWFPQTYIDLATYFKEQGTEWDEVDPKLILSSEYSSGQGYVATRQKIKSLPTPAAGGGGCGV